MKINRVNTVSRRNTGVRMGARRSVAVSGVMVRREPVDDSPDSMTAFAAQLSANQDRPANGSPGSIDKAADSHTDSCPDSLVTKNMTDGIDPDFNP